MGNSRVIFEVALERAEELSDKLYCYNCESVFDADELVTERQCIGEFWGVPAYQDFSVCPCCGSDNCGDAEEAVENLVDGSFENVYSKTAIENSKYFVVQDCTVYMNMLEDIREDIMEFMEAIGLEAEEDEDMLDCFINSFIIAYSKVEKDSCLYLLDDEIGVNIEAGYTHSDIEAMGFLQLAEFVDAFTESKGLMQDE